MKCPQHETLNEYIDGELNPNDRKTFAEHIKLCSSCRQYIKEIKEISFQTAKMPPVSLSQKAKKSIRSKIKDELSSTKPSFLQEFISWIKILFQSPYVYAALMLVFFINIIISTEVLSPPNSGKQIGSYYERVIGPEPFINICMNNNLREGFNE